MQMIRATLIAIAIAIGPIVQKCTPKYTANAQKNIPKTIAAPQGPARATRLGPRPQSGATMVLGILLCAFAVYFGVWFCTIGPVAIAIERTAVST